MARRSGLGKGLSALIPTDVVAEKGSTLREVPIGNIRENPYQPRQHFDEESLAALAASIRELGVLQPVLVRQLADDQYELIAGERRWRAARRAGHQTIPVLVQTSSDVHSLEQALVENLHRQDLNPIEEAAAYQQLIDEFEYTHDQVAARVGKSRVAVTNTLRLLQLPPGVQRALAEGNLTAGHARALLGTPDRAWQEAAARRIVVEGLTVRAVEALVREELDRRSGVDQRAGAETAIEDSVNPAAGGVCQPTADDDVTGSTSNPLSPIANRKLPAPGVLELEELLASYLNTRVKVDMGGSRGRIVIEFATLEDLERIYKLMVDSDQP